MFEGLAKQTGEIRGNGVCLRSSLNQYYWPELFERIETNRDRLQGDHLGPFDASYYHSAVDLSKRFENGPDSLVKLYDEAFIVETGGQIMGEIAYKISQQEPRTAKIMLWVDREPADGSPVVEGINALSETLFGRGLIELSTRLARSDGMTRQVLEAGGWHLYGPQSHEPDLFNMSLTPDMFANRHLRASHQL